MLEPTLRHRELLRFPPAEITEFIEKTKIRNNLSLSRIDARIIVDVMAVESFEPLKDFPRNEKAAEQFRSGIQEAYNKATQDLLQIVETLDAEYAFQALFSSHLRHRLSASLLIAIDADDTLPFELALWAEGPWMCEEVFENYLAGEKQKAVLADRLSGRNEPCFCGGGKKFKKCCIGKARLERRTT